MHVDGIPLKRRDAAATRTMLLNAAQSRFASQGYAATTVREIAEDAGVNAALISRYFDSKEGLFEACLIGVSAELSPPTQGLTLSQVAAAMTEQIAGPHAHEHPNRLVLLLRTSGDEGAEKIRVDTLKAYSERIVQAVSGDATDTERHQLLLHAQLALAAALGIAVVRSRLPLHPLASVDGTQLVEPVQAMLEALLGGHPGNAD